MVMMEGLCYDCRKKEGYKRKDQGAHTAILKDCDGCGEKKVILPSRHWVKARPQERIG
jgi:hypothetical protein